MHHEVHTEIEVEAAPAVVWQILTDLEGYADWNPFITSSAGTPQVGNKLVNRMEPPGGRAITFKPKVTVVESEKTFEWLGRLGVPGVFDGRHRFELQETSDGTKLTQSESFDGILVRFARTSLDTQTKTGFEAMNVALKNRAEATSVADGS